MYDSGVMNVPMIWCSGIQVNLANVPLEACVAFISE